MKKKIIYIIGTRPEIIRSAFIINLLKSDKSIDFKLVHTGQHYDLQMNDVFFEELGVPKPDINLNIGSGSHAVQTAEIMVGLEKFFMKFNPDIVCVFGDTNSSAAAALTAVKMHIPVAHLESGFRDFEMDIPEEINRIIIDHTANLLLPVSEVGVINLKKENVRGDIFNTGDPLYDVFKNVVKKNVKGNILKENNLKKSEYILLTLHRDKNVDDLQNLKKIFDAFTSFSNLKFVFPVHPRTKKQLEKLNYSKDKTRNFIFIEPVNYKDILTLIENSKFTITDSGGLQKEAFWLKKPCLILRENTGWIEPVKFGVSFLTEIETAKIRNLIKEIIENEEKLRKKYSNIENPYYKKNITENNVKLIKKYAGKKW